MVPECVRSIPMQQPLSLCTGNNLSIYFTFMSGLVFKLPGSLWLVIPLFHWALIYPDNPLTQLIHLSYRNYITWLHTQGKFSALTTLSWCLLASNYACQITPHCAQQTAFVVLNSRFVLVHWECLPTGFCESLGGNHQSLYWLKNQISELKPAELLVTFSGFCSTSAHFTLQKEILFHFYVKNII